MGRRIFKTLAVAMLVMSIAATVAHAGRYHVYSCRMPNGAPAPTDGWSGSLGSDAVWDDYLVNSCAIGGALGASLGDETPHPVYSDFATWALEVPALDSVVGAKLWRSALVTGSAEEEGVYYASVATPTAGAVLEECAFVRSCTGLGTEAAPLSAENEVVIPPASLGSGIYLRAGCGGALPGGQCGDGFSDPQRVASSIYLYAADLTLEQTAGPTADDVGGELASASSIAGTSDVQFSAADPGSGIYEALFTVDGAVVQRTVVDEEGGRCRDVGQTTDGLPAFLYLQPCPSAVSADVGFESSRVANGSHHLVVTVLDAAGNEATVLDRNVVVDNPGVPGPPNGLGASTFARLQARWASTADPRLRTAYGHREKIEGRLTGLVGAPIVDAQITLAATPQATGARSVAMRDVTTGPDGEFALDLPRDLSSREIVLSYAARLGEAHASASATLQLAVRAPISLTIAPRSVDVGHTIHFSGRLLAGPVPAGGKPLVLEARSGDGAWIEFDVIRTARHARYAAHYTFKFPGPAVYQFRVVCEHEADYPFAAGASRVVDVFER